MIDIIEKKHTLSLNVDSIFYFVYPGGRQLNDNAEERIALEIAEHLEFDRFATRSGPEVQNPVSLLKELNEVGFCNYEIVLIDEPNNKTIVLSGINKAKFIEALDCSDVNSGIIAAKCIEEVQE